jgi:hypothetical protein
MEVNMKGIVLKVKSPQNFHRRKRDVAYFFKRYGLFSMFLLSILVGLILGIYFGGNAQSEFRQGFDFLFPTNFSSRGKLDFLELFCAELTPVFLFFMAIFLLGFCPWGHIVLPLITMFRGFGAGLTLCELCLSSGMKGFGFFMLAIIPGFFLFSCAVSLLGEQSFRISTETFRVIIRKKDGVLNIQDYFARSGTYFAIAFVSALLDTVMFSALFIRFGI